MKKLFGILTLSCAGFASASAPDERMCLAAGDVAQSNAKLLELGVSEERLVASITDPKNYDPKRPKIRQAVITKNSLDIAKYVYTMRLSQADARQTVYLKCMSGGLGHIDWSKHPAAAKATEAPAARAFLPTDETCKHEALTAVPDKEERERKASACIRRGTFKPSSGKTY